MSYEVRFQHNEKKFTRPIEADNDNTALHIFHGIVDSAIEMALAGWPIGTNHKLFKIDGGVETELKPSRVGL
jgi:hypothetical protein